MAWNRNTGHSDGNVSRKNAGSTTRILFYGIFGIALIAIVVIVAYFYRGEDATSIHYGTYSKPAKIEAPVELSKTKQLDGKDDTQGKNVPKIVSPQRVGEIRNGVVLLPSGELWPVKGVITSRCERVTVSDRAFECFSDRMIGSLISFEPGMGMLGSSETLYEGFDKEFVESLKHPIIVDPKDDDEVKEMKEAVIVLRKDLKSRMDAGESVEKIMIDTRNQMIELAAYKEELMQQVERLMIDSDFSDQDGDDLIKAANQMLEERGSSPLDLPSATTYALLRAYKQNSHSIGGEKEDK